MRAVCRLALFAVTLGATTVSAAAAFQGGAQLVYRSQTYGDPAEKGFGLRLATDGSTLVAVAGTALPAPKVRTLVDAAGVWSHEALLPSNVVYGADVHGNVAVHTEITGAGVPRLAVHRRQPGGAWATAFHPLPPGAGEAKVHGDTIVLAFPLADGPGGTQEGELQIHRVVGTQIVPLASFRGGADFARLGYQIDFEGGRVLATRSHPDGRCGVAEFSTAAGPWGPAVPTSRLALGAPGSPSGPHALRMSSDGMAVLVTHEFAIHVLSRSPRGWFLDETLPAPTSDLGRTYDIDGGRLAVGIPEADGAWPDSGALALWERNDGWKLVDTELAPDGRQSDQLGMSVDLHGSRLLASAYLDDDNGSNTGALYEFEVEDAGARVLCFTPPHSGGCIARIGFIGMPAISGTGSFRVTGTHLRPHASAFALYGTAGLLPFELGGGTRCVAAPRSVASVSPTGGTIGAACSGATEIDFNAYVRSGADPGLVAGVTVTATLLFRDPGVAGGFSSTEALRFTIAP